MELDDSFTESLLQRSRAREDKRIGSSDVQPEESPKRQCVEASQSVYLSHDKENFHMQDENSNAAFAPFHSASKSRGFAALKKNFMTAKEPLPVQNIIPASVQECTNTNVDPAELPLAARKAFLEKALLSGTLNMNEEVIDHTLCVAQRSAMFENPSKANTGPRKFSNFREPKRISIPNFSKFESNDRDCQITKIPVKSVQVVSDKSPIKMTQQNSTKSPIKMTQQNSAKSPVKMTQQNSAKSPIKVTQLNSTKCPYKISQQNRQSIAPSPVTTFQPVLTKSPAKSIQPQQTTGSPAIKFLSTPVSSTPSTTKNIRSHSHLIQQKLLESSGSKLQTKEISAKVGEERKQEISLVKNWEKLSSSLSVENKSEMENDIDPEHAFSESDAVHRASDYDEESNSEDETGNEYDEEDEHKDEYVKECSDEESDVGESVFDSQDSEIASLMSMESNYSNESNIWPGEDTQSISSQNSRSAASSQGDSGVSSYSYSSCYNASRSQSCTSDSSARSYDVMNSDAMEGTSSSFKENNCDIPLLRTVSVYRKQKQESRLTPPVRTIVRRENVLSPDSADDYTEKIQKHIKNLQKEILLQQSIISELSKALNHCSATAEFSVSAEQVEAEKHLLIATQKCQSYLNEISRLKTCGSQGENVIDSEGTLLISDIRLPLKREFMASVLEGMGTDTVHYFLCLIRHGAQVIETQMMSTNNDEVSDGVLCFTNRIILQNLPADFSVVFEVYALQTKKEVLSHEQKYHIKKHTKKEVLPHKKKYHLKKEHSKIRPTPKGKKLEGKILMPAITCPGGLNAVQSTSFGIVGFTCFTLQNCNIKVFTLEKVPFTSPLDGVLRVQLKLHVEEHKIDKSGFLTMFEIVSGLASLHRRWYALDAHYLAYWKYRDDEKIKNPNGVIDLKQCVTGEVKLCSRDVCARPHTFKLVTVSHQAKGDKNPTISSSYNTIIETEHLLTADTKEEGIHWCNKLNEALTHFRKWNPQALHPVASMQY